MKKTTCLFTMVLGLSFLMEPALARDRETAPDANVVVAPVVTNDGYKAAADAAYAGQKKASSTGKVVSIGLFVGAAAAAAAQHYKTAAALAGGGMLAMMASKSNSGSASASQDLSCSISNSCTPASAATATTTSGSSGDPSVTTLDAETAAAVNDLKKAGITVDFAKNTVTTPDGKSYNANSLATPESMSSAGLNPEDHAKLKSEISKLEKKAGTADSMGDISVASGGGGGGGGETAGGAGNSGAFTGQKLGIDRNPAQVAGLKTMFNGEPIGVASDSIFGIVDRRYDLHAKKGSFIIPGQ